MANLIKNCTGIILAGGENRRMPVIKSFIRINGEKIIEKTLKIMQKLFNKNYIVTNQPDIYMYLGFPLLGDIYNIRGPMTGVFTSLVNSSNKWIFVSACDMPFINERLIRYIADKRENYDAVVPVLNGRTEPLFAFYSNKLIISMEKALSTDQKGLSAFLKSKNVKYITTSEIQAIDAEGRSLLNINTPEDLKHHVQV